MNKLHEVAKLGILELIVKSKIQAFSFSVKLELKVENIQQMHNVQDSPENNIKTRTNLMKLFIIGKKGLHFLYKNVCANVV